MDDEKKLMKALRARAFRGACRIDDMKAFSGELGVSMGKLAALLYALSAEGRILQDHGIILLLSD